MFRFWSRRRVRVGITKDQASKPILKFLSALGDRILGREHAAGQRNMKLAMFGDAAQELFLLR